MLESAATSWQAAEIETQASKRPIVDADGDGVTRPLHHLTGHQEKKC